MSEEYLLLKWGTLKGWNITTEAGMEALRRYHEQPTSLGAMSQHDTPEQKQAICAIIDAMTGEIQSDWTGDILTKDEAKKYVLEYRS